MLLWMRSAVDHDTAVQQRVRTAQFFRSRELKAQLDEETGMRGYALTHNRVFLQPYETARAHFQSYNASLQSALSALRLPPEDAGAQGALNREWLTTVAEPVVRRPGHMGLQLRGKALVDRFRRYDEAIYAELNVAADRSDSASLALANRAAFFVLPIVIAIGVLLAFIYRRSRRYEMERRVADSLQRALAPSRLPEVDGADLGAVYVPAGIQARVGGDWYDAVQLPDGRTLFSLGDVAGHGVNAAVTMNRVRQTILSVGLNESDPSAILARANEVVLMQDMPMVTCVCGFVDRDSHVTYSTAGHPPVLHASGSIVTALPYSGVPLGVERGAAFETHSVRVKNGSLLVAYTDGLVELGKDYIAGEARLIEAVRAVWSRPAAEPAAAILERIFGSRAPIDDVAILTIAFREPRGDQRFDVSVAASAV